MISAQTSSVKVYTVSQKTVPLYIRLQLRQMLADFQNSFTVVYSKKFATKLAMLYPPHLRCVAALPCETEFKIQPFSVTAFTNPT